MKPRIGIIIVVILLLGIQAAGCGNSATRTVSNNTSTNTTLPANTPSTATPLTSPTMTYPTSVNSATFKSANGLSLSLSLDSTTYQPGQEISIFIDETNTLLKTNDVPVSDQWPLSGLSVGPCGTEGANYGIAVFRGYYTSADVSNATPLILYNPYVVVQCPPPLIFPTYNFKPLSDIVTIFISYPTKSSLTFEMNTEIQIEGYWTSSPTATLTNFTPGVYTIAGGDEWGTLVILHFTVTE